MPLSGQCNSSVMPTNHRCRFITSPLRPFNTPALELAHGKVSMRNVHSVRSRPAEIGAELMTRYFGSRTLGFAAYDDLETAVSVLPGTKLTFIENVRCRPTDLLYSTKTIGPRSAIVRRIKREQSAAPEGVLEFRDTLVPLESLYEGQLVWVSQLPT
jgi:hypothetical protein